MPNVARSVQKFALVHLAPQLPVKSYLMPVPFLEFLMSLCIVSDMAAREIESVCARERESARVRALNPKPYLGTDFWEFLPGERGEGPSRPSGVDVSAPARSRRAAAEAMRRRANHQRPVQEWREAEVVYMLKSKNNVYTRTYYIYIPPKFL